jgi:hypothetical protein
MKTTATALFLSLITATEGFGQAESRSTEMRFGGQSAVNRLCKCLLDARRRAESEGRLDFAVEVDSAGTGDSLELVARLSMGTAHAVGRIHFVGHSRIDDTTLRRAMVIRERDLFDVRKLSRSLARINSFGLFEPLTLADTRIDILEDGVTADLTIPLRDGKSRWWSVSASMFPAIRLQASISSRLPSWGRRLFEAATYFVSLDLLGLKRPFLALNRPLLPGQELFSGFAIKPGLSPRSMLWHYGRTQAEHALGGLLDGNISDPLVVPLKSSGRSDGATVICKPPRGRLWWLRRGGAVVAQLLLMS